MNGCTHFRWCVRMICTYHCQILKGCMLLLQIGAIQAVSREAYFTAIDGTIDEFGWNSLILILHEWIFDIIMCPCWGHPYVSFFRFFSISKIVYLVHFVIVNCLVRMISKLLLGAGLESGGDMSSEISAAKKHRFPDLRGTHYTTWQHH